MGIKLIKILVVYFGFGIILGYYMLIVYSYVLIFVYVYINLLGWMLFMLVGFIYYLFFVFSESKLVKLYVWLYNIGLLVMMIGLFFMIVLEN